MKRIVVLACLAILVMAPLGTAAPLTVTLGEYSSPFHSEGEYFDIYQVGTFTFSVPARETILSATISGHWGNSLNPTTADNFLFVGEPYHGGLQVADTSLASPDPRHNYFVPWTYAFSDMTPLVSGSVDFYTVQLSNYVVRLSDTTLTMETGTPSVPEPGSLFLVGTGLIGLRAWRKRRRADAVTSGVIPEGHQRRGARVAPPARHRRTVPGRQGCAC